MRRASCGGFTRHGTGLPVAAMASLVALSCSGSGGGRAPALPQESQGPPFAEVVRLEAAPKIPGALIGGEAGDWLLRNDRLSAVVTSAEHNPGFSISGGVLVDAAPSGGVDVIQETYTYFDDRFGRQAVYDTVEPEAGDSTVAVLVATGRDSEDPGIRVETRFVLRPATDFVEIATTVTRAGGDSVVDFALGDVIEWGRAAFFAPGPGRQLRGTRGTLPFLLGFGEGTAYAWVSPEGDLTGPHGHIWSDPIVKTVSLAPGESATYARRLVVVRNTPAAAAEIAHRIRGDAVDRVQVRVTGARGVPVAGAWVEAVRADSTRQGWGLTLEDGRASLPLPAGRYVLDIAHPGRGRAMSDTVDSAGSPEVAFQLPEPVRLQLSARDDTGAQSPAKWVFQGLDGTPDPDLGPDYDPAGAGPFVFTPEGTGETQLPPGHYRVLATRGPAYEAWETTLDARAGDAKALQAELDRLPIPPGWVSADFHVHQAPSYDSNVALDDRARGLVCEGLDWFAASDHGRRTDFTPVLAGLSLAAPLHALVSEEITTFDYGHFNAYPEISWFGSAAGIDIRGLDPDAIFDTVHRENPQAVLQVNHPRAGSNGYFDCMGYDPEAPPDEADSLAKPIRLDFDAMEIVNGSELSGYEDVWKDWMALLEQGRRIVGVGNSDSHHLSGGEPGYPRNYVLVDPDSTGAAGALVNAVRAGRLTVSNGPWIDLDVEGAGVGDTLRTSSRSVTAHIRVLAPDWVDVRRVSLFVNGVEETVFMVAPETGAVRFDEDVEVRVAGRSFVIAVAEGDRSLAPVVPPVVSGGETIPARPLAFTNPVWIDPRGRNR